MFLAALSIVLMTLDHRANYLESIRGGLSVVLYPLQFMVDAPMRASSWAGDTLTSRSALLQELDDLRTRQLVYKAELQKLVAVETENHRLRELLQSSQRVAHKVLIGEILAADLDPFSRQVVLNKGSDHGVYRGQPILDSDGAMGQVIHVGPISSTAMLLTDANSAIPVQVLRNGLRSIAVGSADQNALDLPYLANNADVEIGDVLVTSGLGGRFPSGYPVGRVTAVEKDMRQSYAKVVATPTARVDRVREVLLIFSEQDQAPSVDSPTTKTPPAAPPADGTETR